MMNCPNCLQDNPPNARFCNSCGAPLESSAPATLAAGPVSFGDGRYQVERTLGEGGKGIVSMCRDTGLGRRVAIKLIKEEVMDPDSQARFEREVQSMAQLLHPNVVTIFDIGQENGRYYLVLELMEGGSVEEMISSAAQGRLDVPAVMRIAQDTVRGLAHAHSHGILHRDVKPGNIWMTGEGLAKLGDFGLAYLGGNVRLTRAGMMVGTVAYMAPEVALGRQADERSDLYMLGASLYEMVTGRVPFQGDDPVRIIFSHINDLPLSPQRLVPGLPPGLETLIIRLLAKDPEQRPGNASAVLTALEAVGAEPDHPGASEALRRTSSHAGMPGQPPTPEPRWAQPLVGRDRERDSLRSLLDAAMQGQGGLVFITGEAGIGKTRLAGEIRSYARGRGCQWLEGRFEKEGSIPLQPYVEAVRAYLRTAPAGSITNLVGPYATELASAIPDIATALAPTPPVSDLVEDDPETARQRHLEAMCHLFVGIAGQAPLVLFLDDFQWAPSMDVLRALAQQAPGQPMLIIGAYRDSELRDKPTLSRTVLAMNRDRLFQAIPLSRLNRGEAGHMIAQALGQAATEELANQVYQRTEGNPFFLEELVRYLVESGALTLAEQGWDLRDTSELQMPDSVKVVVEERLEHLQEATRRALAMASLIGQEFALSLLQEVTGVEEDDLVDIVDQAVEARVLVPRPGVGQEVYAFADNQVRQVLYDGTGTARRRRYHLLVGEAIETVHGRRLEEYYDALAHHFLEGNNIEKAVDYSIKAGDLAHGKSSFPRARSHYQVAAELLEELEEESERAAHAYAQLGMGLTTAYEVGTSSEGTRRDVQHIKRALEMFVKLGDVRRAALLYRTLGAAYMNGTGVDEDYTEALRQYLAAVTLLKDAEDSIEKAVAYDGLAFVYCIGLELDRAEELARESLRIAETIQDQDALTLACTELGMVLVHKGHLREGLSYTERSWIAAQQARTPWFRQRAAAYPIGGQYPWLGNAGHYLEWSTRWEEEQSRASSQRYEFMMLSMIAVVSVQGGYPERGRELLARLDQFGSGPARDISNVARAMLGDWDAAQSGSASLDWTGYGIPRPRAIRSALYYGRLLLDRSEYQEAEDLLRPLWEYCHEHGAVTFELNLLPPLVESYVRLERQQEARVSLERAEEILAMPEDWKGLAAGVYLAEAMLAAAEERWEESEPAFQRAVETNQSHGLVYDQARALYHWAVTYLERTNAHSEPGSSTGSERTGARDRDRGAQLLDQALALFQRCDAKKDIERIIARKGFLTA